jgi:hypothetical protein
MELSQVGGKKGVIIPPPSFAARSWRQEPCLADDDVSLTLSLHCGDF